MSDIKEAFGSVTGITITLTSLADGSARESTAVDNSSNLFLDALVRIKLSTDTGTISNPKAVFVYAYGALENTSQVYPDNVTGSDADITLDSPTQLQLIGVIYTAAASTSYTGGPFSVASAFNGVLPQTWGIVVLNDSGVALSSTGGDFDIDYIGVYNTVT